MLKPGWLVNGLFAVIALALIALDVTQRSDETEQSQPQKSPVLVHK